MSQTPVYYLVHIHTPNKDCYILRDSFEDAREEIFQYAQSHWTIQFSGIKRPKSKTEVINKYYEAVRDITYFNIIDIEPNGNSVTEEVN